MDRFMVWWRTGLAVEVKFVLLVLVANGLPAFVILMSMPGRTEDLFVWTVKPEINARLVGVMYGNALILVSIALFQREWAYVRVNMMIVTLFSLLATTLTFFYLDPFLAHPWFHLAYWLVMYLILFFAAPAVFVLQERGHGGRLPVHVPLEAPAKMLGAVSLVFSAVLAFSLLFLIDELNAFWFWTIPPLVGGLIGVLFATHTAAYAWALWDGDWVRVRPMFWQAAITGILFMTLPLVHGDDLDDGSGRAQAAYYAVTGLVVLANVAVIVHQRTALRATMSHAG